MPRLLESEEAARRLGVKVSTLYAYVSRGLLASHPAPDGRRSLFHLEDVEQLAARARGGRRVEAKLASVTTAVTQLRDDGPAYRGHPAVDLAGRSTFEEVAALLWGVEPSEEEGWTPARLPRPPAMAPADVLRWAVVLCGARDPLRADLRPQAVVRKARRLIASAVAALGGSPTGGARSIARGLLQSVAGELSPHLVEAVDAALVVLSDHELATSTVAVRVAASTRADLYDALLAGLATLAGPLHGGASELAYDLLATAGSRGAEQALGAAVRRDGAAPGFGHMVYRDGDPRFAVLVRRVERLPSRDRLQVVRDLVDAAAAHEMPPPNVDLAVAALIWVSGLPPGFGRTMFSVARLAGWTAHYLEELGERPLRFRARAVYAEAR